MTPIAHDPDTAQAEVFLSLLLAETDRLVDHIEHAQIQVEQLAPTDRDFERHWRAEERALRNQLDQAQVLVDRLLVRFPVLVDRPRTPASDRPAK
ncbi:hypothetical protein [Rhodococcus wratislaviensis]|uniref:Uncharacterized protein n=1 Tax=Rhodococcus wratislaviensis NBRC 100605 TaxID=1219028 RepID=X0PRD6_RHOWR|nr:hypothetical protein [Rhodococcus wratislaviensis]GAF45428.1 hypothetical protein RW1_022_00020 [Rhodococcus wratislaviensis NBRC 100605]